MSNWGCAPVQKTQVPANPRRYGARWQAWERKYLKVMLCKGLTLPQCAAVLHRTYGACRVEMMRLVCCDRTLLHISYVSREYHKYEQMLAGVNRKNGTQIQNPRCGGRKQWRG